MAGNFQIRHRKVFHVMLEKNRFDATVNSGQIGPERPFCERMFGVDLIRKHKKLKGI